MRKLLLGILPFMILSCSKPDRSELSPALENTELNNLSAATGYNLVSFAVTKGEMIRWGRCRVATALIRWTATGESTISQYEVLRSGESSFTTSYSATIIAAGSSDILITRSFVDRLWGDGAVVNAYYRLKIYHKNGSTTLGPVAGISVKTPKCDMSGF